MRILRPAEGVLAFYDGRVEGHRFDPAPSWVDEGAISLGIASYAILDGDEALVYDTHVSVAHGRLIRETHLRDLAHLRGLDPARVLPNHGDPETIAGGGGYGPGLIRATQDYIRFLQRCRDEPALRELPLQEVIAEGIASGALPYFEPYEAVHRENLATVLADQAV
ncbi:MAG: hypothetical protein H0X42_07200 [Solirubrobacterales bacterium]|nr:hypothetical protein [Solirubrobacterales bacterium]